MPEPTPSQELSPFAKTVEAALNHFSDPKYLGTESPLAAPYLLSQHLEEQEISAEARGKKLRVILRKAVEKLSGKYKERYQTIIQEYYFKGNSEQYVCQLIEKERGTFYKSRKEAVEQMAAILIDQLQPALQLEAPPKITRTLIGRQDEVRTCQQALESGQSITITGNNGVGKTMLASYVAAQWKKEHVFWYTVRPGFNDHVNGLLFSLGYFLKTLGEPVLWQEIIGQPRSPAPERMVEILRYVLQHLRKQKITPILCFDEIDLLQPSQTPDHSQIIALLDSIRHETPMLLIGQQPTLVPQPFCHLHDLTLSQVSHMLEDAQIRLKTNDIQLIHAYTGGNPRLIELFITLSAYEESTAQILKGMKSTPPLEYFLNKIIQRLTPVETALLKAMSVFHAYAPADVWQNQAMGWAFNRLRERRLLIGDGQGGVMLLPAYRELIYDLLSPAEQKELHVSAAAMYEERAAYTIAAYHWIQASQPERAIGRWRRHQQQEVDQGQARAAHRLFTALDTTKMSPVIRQTHALICADLARLIGDPQQALQEMRSVFWSTPVLAIDAYIAQGVIANDESRLTEAKELFNQAVKQSENLIELRQSAAHKGLSWAHFLDVDLETAWREAQYARYEAENVQGLILEEKQQFAEAANLYFSALNLAEELGYKEGIAKTANNLSIMLAKQGKFEEAEYYHQRAAHHFELISKPIGQLSAQVNLALICNLSGEHKRAIMVLQQLSVFATVNHLNLPSHVTAYINYNLAEAYLGMNDLNQAEAYIRQVMEIEEENLMPDSWRIISEIALQQGDLIAAEKWIQQSLHILNSYPTPNLYLNGYAQRVLARVCTAAGKVDKAIEARIQAIELFQEIGLYHEVEKTVNLLSNV